MTDATYQVLYGPKDTPMDEWEILYANLQDNPAYIQEMYVRRPNWEEEYYAKLNGEPSTHRRMMRKTPADQDYVLRMSQREDYKRFECYRCTRYDSRWTYPELIDGKMHFYASENDAVKDKRTIMGFARYLRTCQSMGEESVGEYCNIHGVPYASNFELRFATTVEEVQMVYRDGPSSCMSGNEPNRQKEVAVYAQAPVAVAYLVRYDDNDKTSFTISSRTVVNMNNKTYVRIYGAVDQMRSLLTKEGYSCNTYDGMDGVVFQLDDPDNIGLPYFDFDCYSCDLHPKIPGRYLIRSNRASLGWSARNDDGTIKSEPEPISTLNSGQNLGDILANALRVREPRLHYNPRTMEFTYDIHY